MKGTGSEQARRFEARPVARARGRFDGAVRCRTLGRELPGRECLIRWVHARRHGGHCGACPAGFEISRHQEGQRAESVAPASPTLTSRPARAEAAPSPCGVTPKAVARPAPRRAKIQTKPKKRPPGPAKTYRPQELLALAIARAGQGNVSGWIGLGLLVDVRWGLDPGAGRDAQALRRELETLGLSVAPAGPGQVPGLKLDHAARAFVARHGRRAA
ncbi:MAG: hypothetical protein KKE73_08255 [Proteobacteria bacterium]|nr:hypothetical protein [Pseudomonadota bacterium]